MKLYMFLVSIAAVACTKSASTPESTQVTSKKTCQNITSKPMNLLQATEGGTDFSSEDNAFVLKIVPEASKKWTSISCDKNAGKSVCDNGEGYIEESEKDLNALYDLVKKLGIPTYPEGVEVFGPTGERITDTSNAFYLSSVFCAASKCQYNYGPINQDGEMDGATDEGSASPQPSKSSSGDASAEDSCK
ncbi:MAG: hypothetical protein EOP04_05435 [Proteobacteria bacterium]|nr:MAG: hypothetical protein EOP04_05435 [Pseudomonadota bacterium]